MRTLTILLLLLHLATLHAQEQLDVRELVTLVQVGVPESEIVRVARKRGLKTAWGPALDGALSAAGASERLRGALERAAPPPRLPLPDGTLAWDPSARVTWFLPAGWRIETKDGSRHFVRDELPYRFSVVMECKTFDIPRERLASAGLSDLGAWHRRRVGEIRTGRRQAWTHVGTWPLHANGIVGVHTVIEDEAKDFTVETYCLTWFALEDRLISISTHIDRPRTHVFVDELLDETTLLLTELVPARVDRAEAERRRSRRKAEGLLLLTKRGAIHDYRTLGATSTERLGRGHGAFTTARGDDTLWLIDDGKLLRTRDGDEAPKELRDDVRGLERLAVDGGGDWITGWRDGTLLAYHARTGAELSWVTDLGAAEAALPDGARGHVLTAGCADGILHLKRHLPDGRERTLTTLALGVERVLDMAGDENRLFVLARTLSGASLHRFDLATGVERLLWRGSSPAATGSVRHSENLDFVYFLVDDEPVRVIPADGGLPVRLARTAGVKSFEISPR